MNLDEMSDEELGRTMKVLLRGQIHDRLVVTRKDLTAVIAAENSERDRLLTLERAKRPLFAHKGFSLAGVIVPAIDARDETLDSVVPANVRVPYNQALHRLGRDLLDPESTWRDVLKLHIAMLAEATLAD